MDDVNLSFLLYVLDLRPPSEVKEHLERIFRCTMEIEKADVPLDERMDAFEIDVLGLAISFRRAHSWTEGNVYRLSGATNRYAYSSTGAKISIDSHIARLLEHGGFTKVMSREAFVQFRDHRRS
jgi:hypothetical protein